MAVNPDLPPDRLWQEYSTLFKEFDDLKLARWMAQTLGQIEGRAWRLSHPLIWSYRLAAHVAHERDLGLGRLATFPASYTEAECCRAPLLPLLTRDVTETGLTCIHCGGTNIPFEDLPEALRRPLKKWAAAYAPVHAVAHWTEDEQKRCKNFHDRLDDAAEEAEELLVQAGHTLAPALLEHFGTVLWEDQDECLEVRPEDVVL